ncbi:hypothetical protein P22_0555 [Propionispora sp. 2/2-37]|uniref:class I SAM-dependent methyltransferase n=1 Tax=Propionispora sp. 2/2-37 TaxID=1677858 RepID=UPI0006BB6AB4|nr:class I SAM-dependent methyltransferase [Propionispora sp. 2/2-37]CUH94489.1 hypothetical protein P22_0555 [Propionispora sp. 2/2-37]
MLINIIKKILRSINPAYRVTLRIEEKIYKIGQENDEKYKRLEKIVTGLNNEIEISLQKLEKKINLPNQNLDRHLINFVGLETAEFIIKNMPKALVFNNKKDLLTHALSFTTNGLFLEFGVYNGWTINIISAIKNNEIIFGFDSFEGLPENWRTGFEIGTFKTDNLPEVNKNVVLIKGWFNQTLPDFLNKHDQQCAFIHIDCDLFSSTKTIFEKLKDRIKSGTIIVFDEFFNYPDWQNGEYKAFQEFINENQIKFEYIGYTYKEQVAVKIL